MPYFDRFDICEAHYLIEVHYNNGGWLHERPSNVRRGKAGGYVGEATHVQLYRMQFKPSPLLTFETLTDNGRDIYRELERRYGFAA
jgi:hypothetical protein